MKQTTKHVFGPGGIACSCCREGSRSDAKRNHSRTARQQAKIALRADAGPR